MQDRRSTVYARVHAHRARGEVHLAEALCSLAKALHVACGRRVGDLRSAHRRRHRTLGFCAHLHSPDRHVAVVGKILCELRAQSWQAHAGQLERKSHDLHCEPCVAKFVHFVRLRCAVPKLYAFAIDARNSGTRMAHQVSADVLANAQARAHEDAGRLDRARREDYPAPSLDSEARSVGTRSADAGGDTAAHLDTPNLVVCKDARAERAHPRQIRHFHALLASRRTPFKAAPAPLAVGYVANHGVATPAEVVRTGAHEQSVRADAAVGRRRYGQVALYATHSLVDLAKRDLVASARCSEATLVCVLRKTPNDCSVDHRSTADAASLQDGPPA